jgi:hypothetical protein
MAAAAQQQQQAQINHLVEEKHFRLKLERSAEQLKTAIEDAIGAKLDELAYGMWSARLSVGRGEYKEITVRALPTDEGTSVEVRIEHGYTPLAVGLYGVALLASSVLLLPLFYVIAKAQERQRRLARERLIEMHKIWTELSAAIGAPSKAGYRGEPRRARVRVTEEEPLEEEDGEPIEAERKAGA